MRVIGGDFAGMEAHFDSVAPSDGPATIYRLILPGDNGIEWRIHADSRLVNALPSAQSANK